MPVTTDLNTCWTEKKHREDAFTARAALENATNVLDECHNIIKAFVDSGSFATIPTDLKATLNDWWIIMKTARTSIGTNSDIMSVHEWRP